MAFSCFGKLHAHVGMQLASLQHRAGTCWSTLFARVAHPKVNQMKWEVQGSVDADVAALASSNFALDHTKPLHANVFPVDHKTPLPAGKRKRGGGGGSAETFDLHAKHANNTCEK